MNAHGGRILAIADHRNELLAAPLLARLDQFLEQRGANAAAGMSVMNVNRIF